MRTELTPGVEALVLLAITFPTALLLRESSLWFLIPSALITIQRRDYAAYGLDLRSRDRWGSVRFHVFTAGTIFIPYLLRHYLLARMLFGQHFSLTLP